MKTTKLNTGHFKMILVLFLLAILNGCSGGGSSGSPDSPPPTTLPAAVTLQNVPIIQNPVSMPSDPGTSGDATITGVDSNNNGIRDDVERWIATNYPNSAQMRAAHAQVALSLQRRITNSRMTTDQAFTMGNEAMAAATCLKLSERANSNIDQEADNMRAILLKQLNTRERINAYLTYASKINDRVSIGFEF